MQYRVRLSCSSTCNNLVIYVCSIEGGEYRRMYETYLGARGLFKEGGFLERQTPPMKTSTSKEEQYAARVSQKSMSSPQSTTLLAYL